MICANMIAFGRSAKSSVPYSARLEYLESTGTQYIDTRHIPTINTKWDITCASTPSPLKTNNGIGVYRASNRMRFSVTIGNGSTIPAGFSFAVGSFPTYYNGLYDNDKHIITFDNACGTSTAYVQFDGVTIHEFGVMDSLEEGASIYLFAYNGTSGSVPSEYKIYSSKLYESDILVQDLIPVLDNNGVACMYDNVSKQCFYNQGTGEFVAGPVEYWGLKFTAEEANSTISMTKGAFAPEVSLLTSTDGVNWQTFESGVTIITLANEGDYVYFKAGEGGNNRFCSTSGLTVSYANYFLMTGKIAASGNIMSLLNGEEQITELTEEDNSRCFTRLFDKCKSLTSAPELPATTLAEYCYSYMFSGCTSLTSAPELPATALANRCYYSMFYNCTSLTTAPELPATTLTTRCYYYMFYGCTSLTLAPALSAKTLADNCYDSMFYGCTSLATAPELKAETLADYCYSNMFRGCTSLTQAPELPATTLASNCYYNIFRDCTSLTQAPELPATTLTNSCYAFMFYGCTNLNSISVNFLAWNPTNATAYWVNGVSSSGTFICPSIIPEEALPEEFGESRIPLGWTVVRK